jgi:hypothetical protein
MLLSPVSHEELKRFTIMEIEHQKKKSSTIPRTLFDLTVPCVGKSDRYNKDEKKAEASGKKAISAKFCTPPNRNIKEIPK